MVERRQTIQEERGPSARNLALVFLASVAVCAVFFSLGFLIGYNQRESKQMPVSENIPPASEIPPPVNVPSQPSAEGSEGGQAANVPVSSTKPPQTPQPAVEAQAAHELPAKPEKRRAAKATRRDSASIATSTSEEASAGYTTGYSVQVMAARTEADANTLMSLLKSRGYPAFVLSPQAVGASDNYFRVLVGPYTNRAAAEKTRIKLEKEGFKPFIKH